MIALKKINILSNCSNHNILIDTIYLVLLFADIQTPLRIRQVSYCMKILDMNLQSHKCTYQSRFCKLAFGKKNIIPVQKDELLITVTCELHLDNII